MSLVDRARKYRTDPLTDSEVEQALPLRRVRSNATQARRSFDALPPSCVMKPTCQRCGPCREWLGRDCVIELGGDD